MVFRDSRVADRAASFVRFVLLAAAGAFVAHEAVYFAEHGQGHRFVEAMSAGGHDDSWTRETEIWQVINYLRSLHGAPAGSALSGDLSARPR